MATTIRSDLVVPEILTEAVRGEFAGMVALADSGAAVVMSAGFPQQARGGDTVTIPYFGNIGEFEDLAANEGGGGAIPALTPAQLTATSDTAAVGHSGKAIEMTEWAVLAANFSDPYGEAARQIRVGMTRLMDTKLITEINTTSLLLDIYDGVTQANGVIDWTTLLDARALWNDEQDDLALIVMHSAILFDLLKQIDGQSLPLYQKGLEALDTGQVLMVPGVNVPIKISDRVTREDLNPDAFSTYLVKRNALAFWFNGDAAQVQEDKDVLSDTRVAALHIYYATTLYSRTPNATLEGAVRIRHNHPTL